MFRDEYMCATSTVLDPIYSAMTLALLEDSGWYQADYSMADTLLWGKNYGCEFLTQDCGKDTSGHFCFEVIFFCSCNVCNQFFLLISFLKFKLFDPL